MDQCDSSELEGLRCLDVITDAENAKISVHVYDSDGNLAEVESWQKQHFAAARVVPKRTGSYYLIVEIEKSDQERTHWALAYGFR